MHNEREPTDEERLVKEISNEELTEPNFDDEEVAEPPRSLLYERPKRKDMSIPIALALVCAGASLFFWVSNDYGNLLWASRNTVFERHEYWRLLTALFTHANILHLLSNLPLFIIFGWLLRTYFGLIAFPFAAIVVGILANFATLYFYPEHVRLIGASGVVYGLVALWITFYLKYEVRYGLRAKLLRVFGFSLVLLFPTTYTPTTSYLAHVFGFIFGIICASLLIASGVYDKRNQVPH